MINDISKDFLLKIISIKRHTEDSEIMDWDSTKISHHVINEVTSGIYRITIRFLENNTLQCDSVILKILQKPKQDLRSDDKSYWNYWAREACFYQSDFPDELSGQLIAPECYLVEQKNNDCFRLWLEDVHGVPGKNWNIVHHKMLAEQLGFVQGTWAKQTHSQVDWLSDKWFRAWVEAVDISTLYNCEKLLVEKTRFFPWFTDEVKNKILKIWSSRERLLNIIEQGKKTFCHYDVWPANLFLRNEGASKDIVLIDWSYFGYGCLGEDIANFVLDSAWGMNISPDELPDFEQQILDGYMKGLNNSGIDYCFDELYQTYALAAGLKFSLAVVSLLKLLKDGNSLQSILKNYNIDINSLIARRSEVILYAMQLLSRYL